MTNRIWIEPFLSKCLNFLTPDRIFRFPKLLGFLHSLLTWVVCIGAKKRFYGEISRGSSTYPIKISGKIIAQAIFNSNGFNFRTNSKKRNNILRKVFKIYYFFITKTFLQIVNRISFYIKRKAW